MRIAPDGMSSILVVSEVCGVCSFGKKVWTDYTCCEFCGDWPRSGKTWTGGNGDGSVAGCRVGTDSCFLGEASAASEIKEISERAWIEDIWQGSWRCGGARTLRGVGEDLRGGARSCGCNNSWWFPGSQLSVSWYFQLVDSRRVAFFFVPGRWWPSRGFLFWKRCRILG